ncbi:hypothetical protein TPHV1_70045 [Treponema phagedenis]|uniref:Uncharacterized protein n=1 Tax=Treponema phagedenis TaxID=162 RepID=A0A0B7GZV4_TREPH|nr:hypothetical protein TPHV1_70045 [Treponema phagedenis]
MEKLFYNFSVDQNLNTLIIDKRWQFFIRQDFYQGRKFETSFFLGRGRKAMSALSASLHCS